MDGTIASALRREGLDLLKQGEPMEAVARLENARHFYVESFEMGIHFMYISGLMSTMAAVKVGCEALVVINNEDFVSNLKKEGVWNSEHDEIKAGALEEAD